MAIIIIRTIMVYLALLVTMRLLGKRQLGEMELSEFVLAALVADLAANPLQDLGMPMINGLVPIVVLFCCEILISGLALKSLRARASLFGRPCLLIAGGRIDQRQLRKNRFSADELLQELRNQSIMDVGQVEYAVLETDGRLNVFPFPQHMPVTPSQLGVVAEPAGYPFMIICDGRVLDCNLQKLGRDRGWLAKELGRRKIRDAGDVFLMTLNASGAVYLALREDAK